MTDAELRLRDAASKKILLEVALLKAIEARNAISLDSVLKQLNQLRGGKAAQAAHLRRKPRLLRLRNAGLRPGANPKPATTRRTRRRHSHRFARNLGRQLRRFPPIWQNLWTQLVEAVGRVSPFTRSYLVDANPVSFEKNILIIGFDPEFEDHLGLVDNARNHTLLQTKLAELGHANCQIKFIKAEAPSARMPRRRDRSPDGAGSPAAATAQTRRAPRRCREKIRGRRRSTRMISRTTR